MSEPLCSHRDGKIADLVQQPLRISLLTQSQQIYAYVNQALNSGWEETWMRRPEGLGALLCHIPHLNLNTTANWSKLEQPTEQGMFCKKQTMLQMAVTWGIYLAIFFTRQTQWNGSKMLIAMFRAVHGADTFPRTRWKTLCLQWTNISQLFSFLRLSAAAMNASLQHEGGGMVQEEIALII